MRLVLRNSVLRLLHTVSDVEEIFWRT